MQFTVTSVNYCCLTEMLFHFQPVDIILVTISELEKLGAFRNVYEDALEISFDKKNPGINTF